MLREVERVVGNCYGFLSPSPAPSRILYYRVSDPALNSSQLVPGYRLDRYELLCPVARGGMAAVWLARFQGKHGFEKLVALKTILPSYANDVEFRRMFLDEATIASRIEHNNVAQILDLGEHEGILYLVMEWVEGDSVSRLERAVHQAGSVIPQAIALRIASDACAGLHAAHELCDPTGHSLGVVHRDVSPQNILLSSKGVVKLIDFGIAKARDRASEDTRSGVFKGKLHYMAPEQALGKAIDRRADVWAVAAVLYRLLARKPVHDSPNRVDTLMRLTSNAPLAPLPAQVGKDVAGVIFKALAFNPNDRHESCAALQVDLDRAIQAEALYTTTSELGAFINLHLASQFEARRHVIKSSMAALSEDATLPKPQNLPPMTPEGSDAEHTLVGGRSGSVDEGAKYEPRSEPPRVWQTAHSEASLTAGSTSLQIEPTAAKGRRKGALLAVAVLGTCALLIGWLRGGSSSHVEAASAVTAAAKEPPAEVNIAPVPSASAAPESPVPLAAGSASPAPTVSVVTVESLAVAPTTATPKAHQVATPPASHAKRKRKIIDDGF